jgi:hypothetical protein
LGVGTISIGISRRDLDPKQTAVKETALTVGLFYFMRVKETALMVGLCMLLKGLH